jgi:crotonobetainyl-CoA:carnitine CoA-transferase CaiB-like acyl-CoA transferase
MSKPENALRGLTVLDMGAGMTAALVAKFLVESGARVIRLEPETGDPFYARYPAYHVWQLGKEIESVAALSSPKVEALLAGADICIIGGEDYPGQTWRRDPHAISAAHEKMVVLNITGYPDFLAEQGKPAAEILAQARSGLHFEHYSSRPYVPGFQAASYGAALQGITALFGAIYAVLTGGRGQVVSASLLEGVLSWCLPLWVEGETPDAKLNAQMPKDPCPLIFQCKDGKYIHFVLGSFGSKGRIYRILQIDDPSVKPDDSGYPLPGGPPRHYFGDVDTLAAHVKNFDSGELLEAITAAEVAAERVLPPGACWDHPQVIHNDVIRETGANTRYVGTPLMTDWVEGTQPREIAAPAPPEGALPLAGLRVLDLGAIVAGPYAAVPLADLGAEVIKVEPLTGDVARVNVRSFYSANRGKTSIAINMKAPEGAEIMRRLCLSADVVINNFRPGVSARLGVDPKSLEALQPGIIALETTGFGSSGPSGQRPGYDMVFQAFCGFESLAGGEGNPPLWNRTAMVDYAAGMCGAASVLLALIARARSGLGSGVQMSLLNAGLFLLSELIQTPDGTFTGARKLNASQTGYHPAEAVYATADGWIAIYAPSEEMAARLVAALGLEPASFPARAAWQATELETLAAAIAPHDSAALQTLFQQHDIWAEPVLTDGTSWLHEPEFIAHNTTAIWHQEKYGKVRQLGSMFQLSGAPFTAGRGVPALSANTREILAALGYEGEQIDALFASKIVA